MPGRAARSREGSPGRGDPVTAPLAALRGCLEFAVAEVPYYRARAAAYDPDHARSPGAFARLPLLTKDGLRAALPLDLLSDRASRARVPLERLTTSGTAGDRITVWADADHVGVPADDLALWALEPDPRLQRVAILTSPQCLGRSCDGTFESRLRAGGTQLILPSTEEPLALDRDLAAAIVAEIGRLDAGELFANPVYLHAVVRACRRFGLALPAPALILLSYQYATRCQRRALAEAFPRARIYSVYGASELGGATVGIECKHARMHVWHDQAYVEVVDDDGRPVDAGVRGNLVITTLGIWVSPLVRYAIGDLGAVHDAPCACPLGAFPTLDHHGRKQDALVVGARSVTTREVDDAIGAPTGLDVWQVEQRGAQLELRCVPALDAALDTAPIAARVAALTGLPVRAVIVDEIDPEPSGKVAHTRRR
jgi:phenylacetate-CoA ligase